MFVHGKTSVKAPYALKVLTKVQLLKLLNLKKKNIPSITLKISSLGIFLDRAYD